MEKITDIAEIVAVVQGQLEANPSPLEEIIGTNNVIIYVTCIYLDMDISKAVGQDFGVGLSIIATPTRVAIIGEGHMSFYSSRSPYITYDNLADDIMEILIMIDAAFQRWSSNCE